MALWSSKSALVFVLRLHSCFLLQDLD
jgi:hypothetical protein